MTEPTATGEPRPPSRRELLARACHGFGGLAACSLLADAARAERPLVRGPHFAPRANAVIFLYMDGGPSQVDTFDPKPRLQQDDGKPFPMKKEPTQFNDNGNTLGSPWRFAPHGESGIPVSELFPHIARCVDRLAVVRSMTADFSEHTNANYFLHTGHGLQGRPSMGAWFDYGLGCASRDLPAFVVLNGGLIPPGGLDCFHSGFLPASHQASVLGRGEEPLANVRAREERAGQQSRKLDLLRRLDAAVAERLGHADAIESAIANHELAARMQLAVPELTSLAGESAATQRLYGLDDEYEPARGYGRQCLLARRLVERGVRFVELTCPNLGTDRWDQHSGLKDNHERNARSVDRGIAGLLRDLEGRGLLDTTLVVWAGEFGRTPFAQGRDGRDHNPFGFSIWLAGGGIRGGVVHGVTDEYGYKVVQGKVTVHDLHATMLHLLGIDHLRLTYRFGGRDIRLTDVYGELIHPILA
ncbi:MAG: DUF1501 domain-containing protein [Planctomycetes bacterium]|nr:DUF1501 domain-containing protein [Planctomycetota bacterium]